MDNSGEVCWVCLAVHLGQSVNGAETRGLRRKHLIALLLSYE